MTARFARSYDGWCDEIRGCLGVAPVLGLLVTDDVEGAARRLVGHPALRIVAAIVPPRSWELARATLAADVRCATHPGQLAGVWFDVVVDDRA